MDAKNENWTPRGSTVMHEVAKSGFFKPPSLSMSPSDPPPSHGPVRSGRPSAILGTGPLIAGSFGLIESR